LPSFPLASPYAGAALDANGDLAVALPYGLQSPPEQPGAAVFPGGSSTPVYYHYGGSIAPVATAWLYGSNATFYVLDLPENFSQSDAWFICAAGTTTCAPPTNGEFPMMTNAVGIAAAEIGAVATVYTTTLGTLGGSGAPFPPVYGTQKIYSLPATGSQAALQNNSSGQPFQTPWGLTLGP